MLRTLTCSWVFSYCVTGSLLLLRWKIWIVWNSLWAAFHQTRPVCFGRVLMSFNSSCKNLRWSTDVSSDVSLCCAFASVHALHMSPCALLPFLPAAASSRHDYGPAGGTCVCVCVFVCVCKCACVSRSRTAARSHWKERRLGGAGVCWMTFGPAAGSCSVPLFLSDPADPALAPVSHTHTHTLTPARSQTHVRTYVHTHTRKHAPACM